MHDGKYQLKNKKVKTQINEKYALPKHLKHDHYWSNSKRLKLCDEKEWAKVNKVTTVA